MKRKKQLRPRNMSAGESMILTMAVLAVIMIFLTVGGCSQVIRSSDPQWEYPTDGSY